MPIQLLSLVHLPIGNNKKYAAKFTHYLDGKWQPLTTRFGSQGYSDYTMSISDKRKSLYLARHIREKDLWYNKPMSAAALSRWLLWNKPTLKGSLLDYIHRFNIDANHIL